jgi:hypothetical protein
MNLYTICVLKGRVKILLVPAANCGPSDTKLVICGPKIRRNTLAVAGNSVVNNNKNGNFFLIALWAGIYPPLNRL